MKLFNTFELRDIQRTLQFLVMAEREGINDLQTLKQKLEDHVENYVDHALPKAPKIRAKATPKNEVCPSCAKGKLRPVINADGLKIMGCSKCRYSTIEGDK